MFHWEIIKVTRQSYSEKIKRETLFKLIQDLLSVKVWTLLASIGLLAVHLINGSNFVTIVGFVLAGRGYDRYVNTNNTES